MISVIFSATPDLTAEFPALAARSLGFQEVPLLCCGEIAVPGAMPRVVRLMMHVETPMSRARGPARLPARRGGAAPGHRPVTTITAAPKSAVVVGTGLIGTSVALALRGSGTQVWLSDTDQGAAQLAADLGAGQLLPAGGTLPEPAGPRRARDAAGDGRAVAGRCPAPGPRTVLHRRGQRQAIAAPGGDGAAAATCRPTFLAIRCPAGSGQARRPHGQIFSSAGPG